MEFLPILALQEDVEITSLLYDDTRNVVLIGVSDGRIIKMSGLASNAYMTGMRNVFAQVKDDFGNISNISWFKILYALKNKIFEVNTEKLSEKWKTVTKPFGTDSIDKITGVFTSSIMWAGEDYIRWNNITVDSNSPIGTGVYILVRAAKTEDLLLQSNWTSFINEPDINLDAFSDKGPFIQFRLILETNVKNVTSIVNKISLSYETKHAVYFFTNRIIMEKNTKLDSGLITAQYTVPQKTEVKFGIVNKNTANWEDYTIIKDNKIFDIPNSFNNKVKIGIKLISYSESEYPVVDEFAIAFGAEKTNYLNK